MTFPRYSSRAVHQTVADAIKTALGALGWQTPDGTPFGAPVLRFETTAKLPSEWTAGTTVEPGLVAITLGDEADTDEQELGGPLVVQDYPIFVDIVMDTDATALAVADDVRDALKGRLAGTRRVLPVIDPATGDPIDGWLIELVDIERVKPPAPGTVHWQTVHVTAHTYFSEVVYG